MFEFCVAYLYQSSPKDESSLLKAVRNVHAMIDKEVAAGIDPNNVFVCGFSQGGLSFTHAEKRNCWFAILIASYMKNIFCRCLNFGQCSVIPKKTWRRRTF